MKNMTLIKKKELQTLVESGSEVSTVAYNPLTYVAPVGYSGYPATSPETIAEFNGWTEFYREDSAKLIEVIFVK